MEHINLSQSLISHHLKDLKDAGVVMDKKRGLRVYYSLTAKGEHIAKYGKTVGTDAEVYSSRFSKYLAQKTAPEKLPEHVSKVKTEIIGSFKQETKKDEKKTVKKRVKKE